MREIIPLHYDWLFNDNFSVRHVRLNTDLTGFRPVTLPHTNQELPYNCFDEKSYQSISCYRHNLDIPSAYKGKCIFLDFDGVASYAQVWLNGEYIGEHKGGYTPFSLEITDLVCFDEENILVVKVDSTERQDIPPFGGMIDYLTYGGIYRDVRMRIVNRLFIKNIFAKCKKVLAPEKELETLVFLENTEGIVQEITIKATLKDQGNILAIKEELIDLTGNTHQKESIVLKDLEEITLWDIDNPMLYDLEVEVLDQGVLLDEYQTKIGFREALFREDGFYLNGRRITMRGLNRHQSYPYVGYAMPERVQRKDADILKHTLRLNTVRSSHYPPSTYFLDQCDAIGLLVLEEIPGWQYIGDKEWQDVACQNVREMIERDWNHPSIVTWGVRINESPDDHHFYQKTNQIARELDDTRQISGVRCIPKSEFLEDIYTMNDFSHCGDSLVLLDQREVTGLDDYVPYLITECNGHMYPTKRFDQEERLQEHALRHLRVHNRAGTDPYMCGLISWCAFDYNTHFEFGSGDRICYHGVMDMFRIPKMASSFYTSQVSPKIEPILEPTTIWASGERSIGGVMPLVIFTNCDYVEVEIDNRFLGRFYPDQEKYPGIEYPPVILEKSEESFREWGMGWFDGELRGYVDNRRVITRRFLKDPVPVKLDIVADDPCLLADGIDATRVVCSVIDEVGNTVPFINDYIEYSIAGPGEIIGPEKTGLIGGCMAVWIKTKREKGTISLYANTSRFKAKVDIITHVP